MTRKMARLFVLLAAMAALFPALALAERVKARVLDIDEKRSEVRVDVAGQKRTYHIDDRSLYRVLRRDRLVVITAEQVRGRHTIVQAEPAALDGRVESLDLRRNLVVIKDPDSRASHTYYFDEGVERNMRAGELVTFEVEERGARQVITRWRRR